MILTRQLHLVQQNNSEDKSSRAKGGIKQQEDSIKAGKCVEHQLVHMKNGEQHPPFSFCFYMLHSWSVHRAQSDPAGVSSVMYLHSFSLHSPNFSLLTEFLPVLAVFFHPALQPTSLPHVCSPLCSRGWPCSLPSMQLNTNGICT